MATARKKNTDYQTIGKLDVKSTQADVVERSAQIRAAVAKERSAPAAAAGPIHGRPAVLLDPMFYPEHNKRLEANFQLRMRMGNFNSGRVSESQLKDIYDFLRDEIGARPQIGAALTRGQQVEGGVTYTVNVNNTGLKDKGMAAEDVTIRLIVPKDSKVVAATGPGYVGVRTDEQAKAEVAEWKVARIGGKERQSYTVTLSKAGTAQDNLRGAILWSRPVKRGANDQNAINPAPL